MILQNINMSEILTYLAFQTHTVGMERIIAVLEDAGLAKKEALTYTALLKGGKMTISELSKETRIKRATVYQQVDALLVKDFITRVPVGKRMFYVANNPKKVLANFEKKRKSLEAGVQEMSAVFNESTHTPKVSFYEGKREIKRIYDDLFTSTGDMYSIFPPKPFFSNFSEDEYREFNALTNEHSFKSKDLMVRQEGLKKVLAIRKQDANKDQQTKVLPEGFESNVDVVICGSKVALISLSNLSALVIENDDIAEYFKNTHAFFWKHI
jgi:HTH-type transcriptional regulator, sugar sensing transcriptional regulator